MGIVLTLNYDCAWVGGKPVPEQGILKYSGEQDMLPDNSLARRFRGNWKERIYDRSN